MNAIELKEISKIYNNSVVAVDNVSLTVNQGEFIAVMGQSGSGKSTLLQIAGLLDTCTSGQVIINGNDVSTLDKNAIADVRMENLGFVFQAFHLNAHLKLYENVMVPMLINEKFTSMNDMKEQAMQLIDSVGLTNRKEHYPFELSGGEQQRVAIARALANDPDFILADEPTGNLDSKNELMVFEELKKLCYLGKGVLVVSHNDAVIDFADKIYTMKDGVLGEK
ncbi:ABC transporter ATP-binding protein [uncultured Ruminococcus sp.]|jgi:ABC-type lipoprotein export system ATPase subunit|uniref:ABC transporter ATP-binding protein n=1 Tax=Ruminococcus sp. TaxID=41978 RepID=UPI000ED4DBB6|nr:ABC transporter ATP-binding protein [uncultured Ruminococcus sp.]HCJ96096.1 ABC transporter ATP-binding protein [Oscillospiraceae bacterium]